MPISRLSVERKKLNYLYDEIGKFNGDPEILSHLTKYLCILTNGYIEETVRNMFGRYAEKTSHPHVANYVQRNLRNFQNAKSEKIIQLTYAFSNSWGHDLETFMTGEMSAGIDSIVEIKNTLAHGGNVGITYRNLKKYWDDTIKVLDFIESQCLR